MNELVIDYANLPGKQQQDELSTFVQEVEQTTQKLMREVFSIADSSLLNSHVKKSKKAEPPTKASKKQQLNIQTQRTNLRRTIPQSTSFIKRSEYFEKVKRRNLEDLHRSKENLLEAECTYHPTILRRKVDVEPLVDRYLDIQRSREKYIFQKRTEAKLQAEQQFHQLTFQPQLNPHTSYQSFEEFYEYEQRWERNRNQQLERKKQLLQVQKHRQCTFQPHIDTKKSPFYHLNAKKSANTKVEDRLHQSLERTMDKRSERAILL